MTCRRCKGEIRTVVNGAGVGYGHVLPTTWRHYPSPSTRSVAESAIPVVGAPRRLNRPPDSGRGPRAAANGKAPGVTGTHVGRSSR